MREEWTPTSYHVEVLVQAECGHVNAFVLIAESERLSDGWEARVGTDMAIGTRMALFAEGGSSPDPDALMAAIDWPSAKWIAAWMRRRPLCLAAASAWRKRGASDDRGR